jgi:hypothetical protein
MRALLLGGAGVADEVVADRGDGLLHLTQFVVSPVAFTSVRLLAGRRGPQPDLASAPEHYEYTP